MIIKSEHEFGEGLANTNIHARWVNSLENEQKMKDCRIDQERSGGDGTRKPAACQRILDDAAAEGDAAENSPATTPGFMDMIGSIF